MSKAKSQSAEHDESVAVTEPTTKPASDAANAATNESKVKARKITTKKRAGATKKSAAGAATRKTKAAKSPQLKTPARKAVGRPKASAEKVNKSEAIRQTIRSLGKRARPKDVVATLAEQGIVVAPAQVSMVRARMFEKKAAKSVATNTGNKQVATKLLIASSDGQLSVQGLLAAKKLADQLGGIEAAKSLFDALAKLN